MHTDDARALPASRRAEADEKPQAAAGGFLSAFVRAKQSAYSA